MEDLKPLPDVDGPKLEPFGHDMLADHVEFLELVQQKTGHGWVIKIKIGEKLYALKIVSTQTSTMGRVATDSDDIVLLPRYPVWL